jgi:hypothetical protein
MDFIRSQVGFPALLPPLDRHTHTLLSLADLWGTSSGFTITQTQPSGFSNAPGSPATVLSVPTLANGVSLLGRDFGEIVTSATGVVFVGLTRNEAR